ncbi:MAG: SCO family protein [Myxococcales bacterium]|nr:SCO family protein [Myxococcales bacterium]
MILAAGADVCAEELNPKEFDGVGITEHLGDAVPADLTFKDETGKSVRLADYFDGEKPVILTLVYYNCPMLCNMVLNGVIEGIRPLDWRPGRDYRILSVSIDHREQPELAAAKKKSYLTELGDESAGAGWHFLTGDRQAIKALADAVGFGFRYDPDRMEYAHGAAIFMVSPEGKLTRYLYGIQFEPKQLKLALTEAGQGKLGSAIDQFVLRCYHYDPDSRKYGIYVWGVMRMGGLLTVLIIGFMLLVFWRRERRRGTVVSPA